MSRYELDKNFRFREGRTPVRKAVGQVLMWIVGTMTLAVVYYVILALFFSTDTEKRLSRENRMYARLYPELAQKQELLGDVTRDLSERDNDIYERIFHTEAPDVSQALAAAPVLTDTVDSDGLVERTAQRAEALARRTAAADSNFLAAFAALAGGRALPPVSLPVDSLSHALTGASAGTKISPFSKVESFHGGLDIIAAQGDAVYATAAGTVVDVSRSSKGLGNLVVIDHGNGFQTRYGHLGNILVSRGQKVPQGKKIAQVGISGKSLVPHLHYEILQDGVPRDPSAYFFASLSPLEYAEVIRMGAATEQSLD